MTVASRKVDLPACGFSDDEWETARILARERWQRHLRREVVALETALRGADLRDGQRRELTGRLASWQAIRVAAQARAEGGEAVSAASPTRDRRPRAVLAHRDPWTRKRLGVALQDHGVRVIASVADGATAVVSVVCAQPEILFVEDRLPEVPGYEVALQANEFSPRTAVGVQAASTLWRGRVLAAGAEAWFGCQMPVVDIAERLVQALRDRNTPTP